MEEKKDYRKELFYEKKNGYDSMDAAAREAMEAYCEGYKAYLNDYFRRTPSAWRSARALLNTVRAWSSRRGTRSGSTTAARP